MVSCEGCGANIDASDKECPYCGHSVIQRAEAQKSTLENQSAYGVVRDDDGGSSIRFGDGQTGARPAGGGDNVSSHYRQGAGSKGNVGSGRLEEKLDQIERIPDPSRHKESKDLGVSLVESMSAIGDLTSFYQSSVSQEAHLSTDERERISKKEERVRPKLKAIVAFCERADSKTKKKIGLSDAEIHKIKTTASRALQLTSVGRCSKCGAMNKPGSKRCQNCGSSL